MATPINSEPSDAPQPPTVFYQHGPAIPRGEVQGVTVNSMRIYLKYIALPLLLLSFGCRSEQSDMNAAQQPLTGDAKQSPPGEASIIGKATANKEHTLHVSAAVPTTLPSGYPNQISLQEAEMFLLKQTLSGQGCGGMTWNHQECFMFVNDYQGKIQTPWIVTPAPLSATYAQTMDRVNNSPIATFLVELRLDDQVYYRDAPQQVQLIWKPTMDRQSSTTQSHSSIRPE